MCVTSKYNPHMGITFVVNFEGSSRQTLSRLSAGTHNIEIKFIPSNFSDFSTLETHQLFNVEPIGKLRNKASSMKKF